MRIYITYQIKKCVCIINKKKHLYIIKKKKTFVYMCVWGCLDKYISAATWPLQTKIPGSAPEHMHEECMGKAQSNPINTHINK